MRKLLRAQQKWTRLPRVLVREGADSRISGRIYVSVVHEFLLYGSYTWVITLRIGGNLGGFHHRVAHRLKGRQPQRGGEGRWVYPPLFEAV